VNGKDGVGNEKSEMDGGHFGVNSVRAEDVLDRISEIRAKDDAP
jgi:hypothetical protein